MMPIGLDNITLISEETRRKVYEQDRSAVSTDDPEGKRKHKYGELEFEALMRQLDNAVSYVSLFIWWHPHVNLW